MDINTLMKLVLSQNCLDQVSKMTGISTSQISSVLTNIVPTLLSGASEQASNKATAESFARALDTHGVADTKDLSSFLGGVDLGDGAKIVQHLLGASLGSTASEASKATGVSAADIKKIMAIVAPLLLTILGQQKKKHGVDGSALLSLLTGGNTGAAVNTSTILGVLGSFLK